MKKIMFSCLIFILSYFGCFSQVIHLNKKESGVFTVNCKVNEIPMTFIFDTGANDVTISKVEARFLIKQGCLDTLDIGEPQLYRTASGSIDTCIVFNIKKLEINGVILENVSASVVNSNNAPLLLGISAIERLGIILIDFEKGIIKIKQ